jgi:hypothetical protein
MNSLAHHMLFSNGVKLNKVETQLPDPRRGPQKGHGNVCNVEPARALECTSRAT